MGLEMKAKWAQGWSVPRHRLWCHRDHSGGPMGEWISALGLNISNCAVRCAKQQSQLNSVKACFSLRLHVYHGLTRGFCSPCQREGEGCGKPCSGNTCLPLPFPTHGTQQATQLQRVPGDGGGGGGWCNPIQCPEWRRTGMMWQRALTTINYFLK